MSADWTQLDPSTTSLHSPSPGQKYTSTSTACLRHHEMPRSRRSAQNARQGGQPTLSFGTQSRVRKPTLPIHPAKKQEEPLLRDRSPTTAEGEPEIDRTTADVVVQDQSKEALRTVTKSRERELAVKVSETQLKRYWKAREAERTAARGMLSRWSSQQARLTDVVVQSIKKISPCRRRYFDILISPRNTVYVDVTPCVRSMRWRR